VEYEWKTEKDVGKNVEDDGESVEYEWKVWKMTGKVLNISGR
jgi:hypothetical protein